MKETKEINRIVNRHKARLLQNLEDVQCPRIFLDAVISSLNWLRSDLNENERNEGIQNDDSEETTENFNR